MDILTPYLELLSPDVYVCTHLPEGYPEKLPIVRVYRGGGGEDYDNRVDWSAVQVGAFCETRADAWELVEYCRQMLLSLRHGGRVERADGSITVVKSVSEMVGPQILAELDPEVRFVPMTFRVECAKPHGSPNYVTIREQLNP
ncbi:hypothetical protein C5613_14885 [Rhodococcus opacus]|uniref:Tail terminator n=2 Tax=Rhodococcus opacus TaxID=37919 RepID=A0A2S8JB30_RHOOP|nr:hypothetical protein [Rhodococcus opacus]PQP24163.1 hypothetical protein C5613_14885 [Rhodococcus opacus]